MAGVPMRGIKLRVGTPTLANVSAAARRSSRVAHPRFASTSSPGSNVAGNTMFRGILAGMGLSLAAALIAYRSGVISLSNADSVDTGSNTAITLASKYGTHEDVKAAISELRAAFPNSNVVSTEPDALKTYGSSPNSYHPTSPHSAVVHASSTEDVVKVVNIARKYKIPIVAYAGATSLEGHFSGVRRDHSSMRLAAIQTASF